MDGWDVENSTALFTPGTGNQGGEGTDNGQEWYIEVRPASPCYFTTRLISVVGYYVGRWLLAVQNILEELDSEREWYYDWRQGHLYFAFNGTQPTSEQWVATRTKVLFNVSGTATAPAKDITIKGIQIRDTALTWLDPHGLPSGD